MKTETSFLVSLLKFVVLLPFLLVKIILGKEKPSTLLTPLHDGWAYVQEGRFTFWLIVVNLAVFIFEIYLAFFHPDVFASLIFEPADLWLLNVVPVIASWFLHASIWHLLGNMLFLFIFGRVVEEHYGAWMLLIYFFSAIVADIVSALAGLGGIGASGAIAGLIATAMLLKPFRLTYVAIIPLPLAFIGMLAIFADISGVFTPVGNTNHFAHLGGYIAVTAVVLLASKERGEMLKKGLWINLAILVFAFFMGFLF